jgi:hypothetical protein
MNWPLCLTLFATSIVVFPVVAAGEDTSADQTKTADVRTSSADEPENPKSENDQSAAAKNVVCVDINQDFTLGDYSYRITRAQRFSGLNFKFPDSPHRHFTAPNGAMYIVVDYVLRYDGKQSVTAKPCSLSLLDYKGREYKPDNTVLDVVRGTGRILRANHPGVSQSTYTIFLVPRNASPFSLAVQENAAEPNRKLAMLDIIFSPASPTAASAKSKSKHVARRSHNSEQEELWRRMDRPWGTPWRSFSAPDEHNYPNN